MEGHIWQSMWGQPYPITGIEYYIKMRMESSTYDYTTAYMCEYHQQEDYQTKWCALICSMKTIKNLEGFFEERIMKMYNRATAKPSLPSTIPAPLAIEQ